MLNTTFQIVMIIWGCLSILLVIGLAVAGIIIMKRAQVAAEKAKEAMHQARDTVINPVERAKEGWAYVRGTAKGVADSVGIMRGKEVAHNGDENKQTAPDKKQ